MEHLQSNFVENYYCKFCKLLTKLIYDRCIFNSQQITVQRNIDSDPNFLCNAILMNLLMKHFFFCQRWEEIRKLNKFLGKLLICCQSIDTNFPYFVIEQSCWNESENVGNVEVLAQVSFISCIIWFLEEHWLWSVGRLKCWEFYHVWSSTANKLG